MKKERWALSEHEMRDPSQCNSKDELIAMVESPNNPENADTISIIVLRNGKATNRYGCGKTGAPIELRELAENEDTLYHPRAAMPDSTQDSTDQWRDVIVNDSGNFIRFAEKPKSKTVHSG